MSSRENLNSSGKSSFAVLKWDQKLNFAFYDIRRVFTDRITYIHKTSKVISGLMFPLTTVYSHKLLTLPFVNLHF